VKIADRTPIPQRKPEAGLHAHATTTPGCSDNTKVVAKAKPEKGASAISGSSSELYREAW